MRECLSLHIGQAGVQTGNACWELYCLEHNIKIDGRISEFNKLDSRHFQRECQTFFAVSETDQFVPRALFIDSEPTVIDEIRTGAYRNLYHPDYLISSKEDAANNYGRGYYQVGSEMFDGVADTTRLLVENCDALAGFFIHNSFGGGTGSGFLSLFIQELAYAYAKTSKLTFSIYPSPQISTTIVEPYNSVLLSHRTMDNTDICFISDNQALYNMCHNCLNNARPTYSHLNRLMAQVSSCITCSLRFDGAINVDLTEFQTNLVPYPRIHFPLITYAPIVSMASANHTINTTQRITRLCFEKASQLVVCDPLKGKFMACCLLYRGDIDPSVINSTIHNLKASKKIQFVDWCPTGFKVGINYQPHTSVPGSELSSSPRSVCMLSNNTSIRTAWLALMKKFNRMFAKRAFIHWYVAEGMDEADFQEAKNNLSTLLDDYLDACSDTVDMELDEKLSPSPAELPSPEVSPVQPEYVHLSEVDNNNNYISCAANEWPFNNGSMSYELAAYDDITRNEVVSNEALRVIEKNEGKMLQGNQNTTTMNRLGNNVYQNTDCQHYGAVATGYDNTCEQAYSSEKSSNSKPINLATNIVQNCSTSKSTESRENINSYLFKDDKQQELRCHQLNERITTINNDGKVTSSVASSYRGVVVKETGGDDQWYCPTDSSVNISFEKVNMPQTPTGIATNRMTSTSNSHLKQNFNELGSSKSCPTNTLPETLSRRPQSVIRSQLRNHAKRNVKSVSERLQQLFQRSH